MTAVTASPRLVEGLGEVLSDGAQTLALRSRRLHEALDSFFSTRSEFGPTSSSVSDVLETQGRRIGDLSGDLESFVAALCSADQAGATISLGRMLFGPSRDLLLIDEDVLGAYEPIGPHATVGQLVQQARALRDAHLVRRPHDSGFAYIVHPEWYQELDALENRLRQLEALAHPPHPGWAGAGAEQWSSAQELLDAMTEGRAIALTRQVFGSAGPFLETALEHDVLLTPGRVAILDDLDALAAMPLPDFLIARGQAAQDRPFYDWTADGCSGPIPGRAEDTCLRHDFLYRNSRMIRDQWGTRPHVADEVKDFADHRFGAELDATYGWWERAFNNPLRLWLDGAEVAVTLFGDVGVTWNPPARGEFYGSVEPE